MNNSITMCQKRITMYSHVAHCSRQIVRNSL